MKYLASLHHMYMLYIISEFDAETKATDSNGLWRQQTET